MSNCLTKAKFRAVCTSRIDVLNPCIFALSYNSTESIFVDTDANFGHHKGVGSGEPGSPYSTLTADRLRVESVLNSTRQLRSALRHLMCCHQSALEAASLSGNEVPCCTTTYLRFLERKDPQFRATVDEVEDPRVEIYCTM